jgi:hypothetical protein
MVDSAQLAKREHLRAGSQEVVEGEEGVGGGVGVHACKDVVERLEARGELGRLGAEDGVLGVDAEEALRGEAERGGGVRVLPAELRGLRGEVVEVALLAHPRPPRRLAVGEHALGAALLHERPQLRLRPGSGGEGRERAPAPARGSHAFFFLLRSSLPRTFRPCENRGANPFFSLRYYYTVTQHLTNTTLAERSFCCSISLFLLRRSTLLKTFTTTSSRREVHAS